MEKAGSGRHFEPASSRRFSAPGLGASASPASPAENEVPGGRGDRPRTATALSAFAEAVKAAGPRTSDDTSGVRAGCTQLISFTKYERMLPNYQVVTSRSGLFGRPPSENSRKGGELG